MWFRVDHKRQSRAQKFIVRCMAEMAGSRVAEEREVKGTTAARKTAEILASSLNVTATVYGTDADGEFVYGVFEVAESAAGATSAVIKKLFAESAAASLTFKDQLLADIPEKPSKASRPCRRRLATSSPSISRSNARELRRSVTRLCSASFAARASQARFRSRRRMRP